MNWKRWITLVLLESLVAVVGLVAIVNFAIDPYGELNLVRGRWNAVKFYQLHETAPFKFARKLRTDSYALVFGTSHSATISSELAGERVLNLSLSVYGNPIDALAFFRQFTEEQWARVTRVYFDVDYFTLKAKRSVYDSLALQSDADFLFETMKTLDLLKVQRSLECVSSNLRDSYTSYVQDDGVFVQRKEIDFDPTSPESRQLLSAPVELSADAEALAALATLRTLLDAHRVPVTFFNTAFSLPFLERMTESSLIAHYRGVVGAVGRFYSLLYLDGISEDAAKFRDPTHHKFEVTRLEMQILRSPSLARRYVMTPDTLTHKLGELRGRVSFLDAESDGTRERFPAR